MTALRRIFLRCDLCEEFLDSATVPSAWTVPEAREQARRAGWRRDKLGRDVCSAHPKLKGART